MAEDIDRLELQVEAQAAKANKQLDALINKLERVSTALTGVNASGLTGFANGISKIATASSQLGNVKTADFTRLAQNLEKIAKVDQASLNRTASALGVIGKSLGGLNNVSESSVKMAEFASSISKLGNKGVQSAMENMPKLASSLNDMMGKLSKAPVVSENLIKMTSALANLASQGSKVGAAVNAMGNKGSKGVSSLHAWLQKLVGSTGRATKATRSFAQVAGSFYANFYMIIRGLKGMWKSVESSMDFLETVNYFEVAMRKLGDDAAANWEQAGYDSAESYANSFSERAKQLTEKMTGYKVDKEGNASYTGIKNLGMNPDSVMNYQAMFAQVSESIGVAEESALNFSDALTMLGADWASLRNTTFEEAWGKFASALAGQSRAVRAFGIDITNATLQEYAYKYGLSQAVSEMNQATKAQLRLLAILDQSKVAFGDLANTMQSPANQLRMLKQNFANLARTIGNLFLPIVEKVLPYINGLVMAVQRLFQWIGGLLGIKFNSINSSIGGMDSGIADLVDGAEDADSALGGANDSAKKLKNTILGFDEINQLNDNTDSSGGGSGSGAGVGGGSALLDEEIAAALAEYQKAWDDAFGRMENKAQDIADRICNAFKRGDYEGIGKYISDGITGAIDSIDWDSVYSVSKDFGKGFAEFLNGLITPELFAAVGRTIAGALNTGIYNALAFGKNFDFGNLGESIASGINEVFKNFDFAALADTLNTWVDGIEEAIGEALRNINWGDVLKGVKEFLSNLEFDTVAVIIGTVLVKKIGRVAISTAIKGYIAEKIASLIGGISLPSLPLLITTFTLSFQGTAGFDVVADWVFTGIDKALSKMFPDLADFFGEFLVGFCAAGAASAGNPLAAMIGGLFTSFPVKINWFGQGGVFSFEWTNEWFENAKKAFATAFDGNRADILDMGSWILEGILDGFVGAFSFIIEPIARFFDQVVSGVKEIFGINSPAKEMKPFGEYILLGIVEGFSNKVSEFNTAITRWFNESVKPWFTSEKWKELGNNAKSALKEKWESFTSWWDEKGFTDWWNGVKEKFDKKNWDFSGIKEGLSSAWNSAVESIKSVWRSFTRWLNQKLTLNIDTSTVIGKGISSTLGKNTIKLGDIPMYAGGGYPNTGELFLARENGINEMVGHIGNKPAVANNDQITQAFASEIKPAMTEAFMEALISTSSMNSLGGNEPVVEVTIKADSETIYNIVRKGKEKSDRRYHVVTEF